jgi:hypothetical protein
MFLLDDGTPVLSATDLTSHLACEHLSQQRRAIKLGERARPSHTSPKALQAVGG